MLFSFERPRVCACVEGLSDGASVLWEKEANGTGSVLVVRKVQSLFY